MGDARACVFSDLRDTINMYSGIEGATEGICDLEAVCRKSDGQGLCSREIPPVESKVWTVMILHGS